MKDKSQKYISSQWPEKSHLPTQKNLSVHDTFCWIFLFVWDFTVAGILNLFLGGVFGGIFFNGSF